MQCVTTALSDSSTMSVRHCRRYKQGKDRSVDALATAVALPHRLYTQTYLCQPPTHNRAGGGRLILLHITACLVLLQTVARHSRSRRRRRQLAAACRQLAARICRRVLEVSLCLMRLLRGRGLLPPALPPGSLPLAAAAGTAASCSFERVCAPVRRLGIGQPRPNSCPVEPDGAARALLAHKELCGSVQSISKVRVKLWEAPTVSPCSCTVAAAAQQRSAGSTAGRLAERLCSLGVPRLLARHPGNKGVPFNQQDRLASEVEHALTAAADDNSHPRVLRTLEEGLVTRNPWGV